MCELKKNNSKIGRTIISLLNIEMHLQHLHADYEYLLIIIYTDIDCNWILLSLSVLR